MRPMHRRLLVKKRDGTDRHCIDYRLLNKSIVFDTDAMSQAKEIFAKLVGSKLFFNFNMCKGYWDIPMEKNSKDYTIFTTFRGSFRFNFMPFGLSTD